MKNKKHNEDDLFWIKEFKTKLRNTKIKGNRLFFITCLEDYGVATKKQLEEMESIKKEIRDWELERAYYCERYVKSDERDFRDMIHEMEKHNY